MPSIISGSDDFNTNRVSFGSDQVFTSSGTFNVPLGVSRVKVTVIGAGGNGGNGVTDDRSGGGGGAGGYVVDYVAVTAGGTATVTVGTSAGTKTSSFAGATTITAAGGNNGSSDANQATSAVASVFGQTYYLVGAVRHTNVAISSMDAGNGQNLLTTSGTVVTNGTGACYGHGYGAAGTIRTSSGASNSKHIGLFGGGGGGGSSQSGYTGGGAGGNGLVIVEW
jgi:hypothetical protein